MKHTFMRIISKKVAINQYGKLGFRDHIEGVFFSAATKEEAMELINPFNYKKHIKFRYFGETPWEGAESEIIDLGPVPQK